MNVRELVKLMSIHQPIVIIGWKKYYKCRDKNLDAIIRKSKLHTFASYVNTSWDICCVNVEKFFVQEGTIVIVVTD